MSAVASPNLVGITGISRRVVQDGALDEAAARKAMTDAQGAKAPIAQWLVDRKLVTAAQLGMPVSTTHSISTAIMGVGFGKNPRKLKVTVIERIVWAWILTIPAAAGIAYGLQRLIEAMGWT